MGQFKVGFGRVNITPDFPTPLDSYGTAKTRIHDRVLNELYYTAIAITGENGKTILITTYDITQCPAYMRDRIAERVKKELGIEDDYFHLSGTHTHSSVAIWVDTPEMEQYRKDLVDKALKACKSALLDQKEAEIYVGTTKTEGLNFVRHYLREDGTYASDNHGNSKAPIVKHMTEADNSMRIIKFVRKEEDGSEARDVIIVNWQAHNHVTGGSKKKDLAADYSGALRSFLEAGHDCYATFLQGCAGNLNEISRIPEENRVGKNYLEYGRLLASYVDEIYDNEKLTKMPTGDVISIKETFNAPVNRAESDKLADAIKVNEYKKKYGVVKECTKLARELGFESAFHAAAIVKRSEIKEDFIEIPLRVHRIGDIGWSAAPFEMFDQTGKEIRENSPFDFTVTQGYTDANFYYLPTKAAYDYGCYEVDTTRYAKGTAEAVGEKIVEMLKSIK